MTLSMYQASVPVFVRTLTNLSAILDKAVHHAAQRKIEPSVLLGTRLFPDMFPLLRQVQLTSDFAKGTAARLAAHHCAARRVARSDRSGPPEVPSGCRRIA